jgi:hypothetical protein
VSGDAGLDDPTTRLRRICLGALCQSFFDPPHHRSPKRRSRTAWNRFPSAMRQQTRPFTGVGAAQAEPGREALGQSTSSRARAFTPDP